MSSPIYARRRSGRPLPHLKMENISNIQRDGSEVITTVFVSNLHCSSCVHTIEGSLSSLSPAPSSIDVSIVTQTVTVKHTPELSPYDIKAAIDAAGFDIVATPSPATGTTRTPLSFTHTIARIPAILTGKSDKHLQQCAACQEERRAAFEFESSSSPHVVEREKFGEDTLTGDPEIKKVPLSGHPSVRLDHESEHGPQRVTLSVGGMTCASCSNAVTHALSELPGISDAVINLLGNSATLKVERADLVPTLVETIEDIGYEAEVISVEPLRPLPKARQASRPHTDGPQRLTLSVGGMTCASCSNTVMNVVSQLPGVSDVVVNLLGGSATALIERNELAPQVVEAIEDAGYEAEIISTENIQGSDEEDAIEEIGPRTVSLRIDGMFCESVPTFSFVMDVMD